MEWQWGILKEKYKDSCCLTLVACVLFPETFRPFGTRSCTPPVRIPALAWEGGGAQSLNLPGGNVAWRVADVVPRDLQREGERPACQRRPGPRQGPPQPAACAEAFACPPGPRSSVVLVDFGGFCRKSFGVFGYTHSLTTNPPFCPHHFVSPAFFQDTGWHI